jgi:hypothetical protein
MPSDRNWSQYNKALINRGKIDFWIDVKALGKQPQKIKKNGHPFVYANLLILAMSYIRFKFHLSLRKTQGYFMSVMTFIGLKEVPCYTQLCRRFKTLSLPAKLLDRRKVTDIVLDTTGLKVYGEGEWRAEKYGGKKRWKKLHLAIELHTGKLVFSTLSHEHVHDTTYLEKVLQMSNRRKGKILIDGIGDTQKCYELAERYNKGLLTPPKKGAVIRPERVFDRRNDAVKIIKGLGGDDLAKMIWSKLIGYSKRVVVESAVARWKRLYGGEIKSRTEERMAKEISIKSLMINRMIEQDAAA